MCKSRPCKMVFFPCRHACVCNECMKEHNIGTKDTREQTAWRACPLCMEEIKIVLLEMGMRKQSIGNGYTTLNHPYRLQKVL